MTTESVLEKLKEVLEMSGGYSMMQLHSPTFSQRVALEEFVRIMPRLIAALELMEAKAADEINNTWDVLRFAREVLAVVNGETKGE